MSDKVGGLGLPTKRTISYSHTGVKTVSDSYVKFFKINPNSPDPSRGTSDSAGIDLYAAQTYSIPAGKTVLVSLGISMKYPSGNVAFLVPRSSLHKRGLIQANSVGIIDIDFSGPGDIVHIPLTNIGSKEACIWEHEKIAQVVLLQTNSFPVSISGVNDNNDNDRGGFGSTGGYVSEAQVG